MSGSSAPTAASGSPRRVREARGTRGEPLRSECGQAAVELVSLLPLLVAVALAAGHVLAAGAARELAGHAAEAAAIAVLRDEDATAAARASLPSWSRDRLHVGVRGRAVRVRVEPLAVVPGVAEVLSATATAHAGPEPSR